MAFIHSIICYTSPPQTSLRQFSGPSHLPHTALLAHVYGIKNVYSAAIRAYAAFHIGNSALYDLAILTYVGVLWLFVSELFVWKTVRGKESVIPFCNAGVGFVWMVLARGFYVRGV